MSAALPGVAVAVALVPPLAAIGYALALGRSDLAEGAVLLYLANLVAIVLSSVVVLLLAGFVPGYRLATATPRVVAGVAAVVIASSAIGVPLASACPWRCARSPSRIARSSRDL